MSRPLQRRRRPEVGQERQIRLAVAEVLVQTASRALAREYGITEEKARGLFLAAVRLLLENGLGG